MLELNLIWSDGLETRQTVGDDFTLLSAKMFRWHSFGGLYVTGVEILAYYPEQG